MVYSRGECNRQRSSSCEAKVEVLERILNQWREFLGEPIVFNTSYKRPSFSALISAELDAWRAIQLIQEGLPTRVVFQAAKFLHVEPLQLTSALSLRRTLCRQSSDLNRSLSQVETERMVRLADITRRAIAAFGNSTAAAKWLPASNIALAGASPLEFVATDLGAREVRRVIAAISYGAAL